MVKPRKLNNGKVVEYGFGFENGTYRGLDVISHSGAWAGFRSGILRFPAQKFSAMVISNVGSFDADSTLRAVADLYLGDQLKGSPPHPLVLLRLASRLSRTK